MLEWFGQIPIVSYRLNDRLFHRFYITKSLSLQYSQLYPSLLTLYVITKHIIVHVADFTRYMDKDAFVLERSKCLNYLLEKSLRVYVFLEIMLSQVNGIKKYRTVSKNYLNSETQVKETLYINMLFIFQS